MVINKLIASLQRKKTRRETVKAILSRKQFNNDVVNIHRLDTKNIGDYYCAPHHYFEQLKSKHLDIFDYKSQDKNVTDNFTEQISDNALIIGGGGLLNRGGFRLQMKLFEKLAGESSKKTVLWGVGHNAKSVKYYGNISNYNIDISKFGLAGTRDLSMPGEYVPCVSCLHPVFDKAFTETEELGLIFHKDTVKKKEVTNAFSEFPTTSNTTNLEELISFIGKCNTIVTDSYHAMYWSMLLGKKVAVVPNSSKFYDFKHKPIFTTFNDCLQDVKKTHTYSGVLEECREINLKFSGKVFDYLEL